MLFGVGIDIENHNRFIKYQKSKDKTEHLSLIYSEKELKNYSQFDTHLTFAISFCCKESFFKSFGVSWNNSPIQLKDIELIFDDSPEKKKVSVSFLGYANEQITNNNIINPPYFDYTITDTLIIFESILACKTK
jgi:phosphopantetheine--protein transferase-like protein